MNASSSSSIGICVFYACWFQGCCLRLNDPDNNARSISATQHVDDSNGYFNAWGEVLLKTLKPSLGLESGKDVSLQVVRLDDYGKYKEAMLSLKEQPILLVLARYHEDVNWAFDTGVPALVMNRGEHIYSNSSEVTEQPDYSNVGREGYLYLQYILANYDTEAFPDIVAFCQSEPTYKGNTKEILLDDMRNLRSLRSGQQSQQEPLNPRWGDISTDIQNDGFAFLGTRMYPAHFGESDARIDQMNKLFQTFMPGCNILDQHFTPGGCIAVTRAQILSQSKGWYEKLIRIGNDENRPLMCFTNERTWACLFTKPGRQCICG